MAVPDPAGWQGVGFREELRTWVEEIVCPVVAMEQAKLRPWASVWQVRTEHRSFYAKQNAPGQLFEAGLMALLAELAPSYVLAVTGVDVERGLLLTPDQGQVFGETVAGDDLDSWCRLVARAMELARVVTPHSEALLASGVTTCRVPQRVEATVASCLDELAGLGLPTPSFITICTNTTPSTGPMV